MSESTINDRVLDESNVAKVDFPAAGGPIRKNKLFFFAGYQATLQRSAPAAAFANAAALAAVGVCA